MELDRSFGGSDLRGYLLVKQTGNYPTQYFLFAWTQQHKMFLQGREFGLLLAPYSVLLNRPNDRVEQFLVVEWLGQEVNRARFHGTDRHGNVALTGDKDYWNCDVSFSQLPLEIEAAYSWQPNVQGDTGGHFRWFPVEKLSPGTEDFDLQTHGADQPPQGLSHGDIIIDYQDEASRLAHRVPTVFGRVN
jgi:hypothetical protein